MTRRHFLSILASVALAPRLLGFGKPEFEPEWSGSVFPEKFTNDVTYLVIQDTEGNVYRIPCL